MRRIAALAGAAALVLLTGGPASAGVATTVTWNNGTDHTVAGDTYRVQSANQTWSMKKETWDNAAVSYRFEERSGDQWANDQQNFSDGRQRDQLRDLTTQTLGASEWVSFDFMYTGTLPSSYLTIFEAHQDPEACDTAGRPGSIALQFKSGSLHLYTNADSGSGPSCSTSAAVQSDRWSVTNWTANTWHNVVLHWVLDPAGSGSGVVHLWVDGSSVYLDSNAKLGFNDAGGDYFKIGQYRAAYSGTVVCEFGNYEAGTASLFDRVANPLPDPA